MSWHLALLLVSATGGAAPAPFGLGPSLRAITDQGVVTLQCRPAQTKSGAVASNELTCRVIGEVDLALTLPPSCPAGSGLSLMNPFVAGDCKKRFQAESESGAEEATTSDVMQGWPRNPFYDPNVVVDPFEDDDFEYPTD